MTTLITIDTTLISAIISAAVAIFVACITLVLTNRSNRKLESNKLKNIKKEELFDCHISLLSSLADSNNFNYERDTKIYSRHIESRKGNKEKIEKIKLLTQLYFTELDSEYSEALNDFSTIDLLLSTNRRPKADLFFSTIGKMNVLSDKIINL
ncbi:TPA: hypothetical protein ACLFK6_002475 [Serratia marcescens]|nr:hypothetical protein [Serratia marcescens]